MNARPRLRYVAGVIVSAIAAAFLIAYLIRDTLPPFGTVTFEAYPEPRHSKPRAGQMEVYRAWGWLKLKVLGPSPSIDTQGTIVEIKSPERLTLPPAVISNFEGTAVWIVSNERWREMLHEIEARGKTDTISSPSISSGDRPCALSIQSTVAANGTNLVEGVEIFFTPHYRAGGLDVSTKAIITEVLTNSAGGMSLRTNVDLSWRAQLAVEKRILVLTPGRSDGKAYAISFFSNVIEPKR